MAARPAHEAARAFVSGSGEPEASGHECKTTTSTSNQDFTVQMLIV